MQRLRARGVKAGLLRLRVLRPFPAEPIAEALESLKAIAVIDQNLAPGLGGITYQEIATALYGHAAPPSLLSVIGGLGGKDISTAEFDAVFPYTPLKGSWLYTTMGSAAAGAQGVQDALDVLIARKICSRSGEPTSPPISPPCHPATQSISPTNF